jgi:hypothetical protein
LVIGGKCAKGLEIRDRSGEGALSRGVKRGKYKCQGAVEGNGSKHPLKLNKKID